jgi:hypothetical protein
MTGGRRLRLCCYGILFCWKLQEQEKQNDGGKSYSLLTISATYDYCVAKVPEHHRPEGIMTDPRGSLKGVLWKTDQPYTCIPEHGFLGTVPPKRLAAMQVDAVWSPVTREWTRGNGRVGWAAVRVWVACPEWGLPTPLYQQPFSTSPLFSAGLEAGATLVTFPLCPHTVISMIIGVSVYLSDLCLPHTKALSGILIDLSHPPPF